MLVKMMMFLQEDFNIYNSLIKTVFTDTKILQLFAHNEYINFSNYDDFYFLKILIYSQF